MAHRLDEPESRGLLDEQPGGGNDDDDDDNLTAAHRQVGFRKLPWRSWPSRLLSRRLRQKRSTRLCLLVLVGLALSLAAPSFILALLFPIYTTPPAHYNALREHVASSTLPGRGNTNGKRVFIAANIVDAELIRGPWGRSIKELVELIGPDNAFISIYENDSGQDTASALDALAQELHCGKSIVGGAHLDLDGMPTTTLPGAKVGVKRVEYLAQVRNRAMRPLDPLADAASGTPSDRGFVATEGQFDRILFLNDVYFDPVDALQLLFSTNADEHGDAQYEAACAADFMSVTNYYDDFATRDAEGFTLGYGPGFRIFPWFSGAGAGRSRREVLAGRDAVAVKSCWGGMVAFNAKWFQQPQDPIRFRSEPEPYWDASECCLVHADITQQYRRESPDAADDGIFLNPYVRVAYKPKTFGWRRTLARFEHGLAPLQALLTLASGYPRRGERRLEEAGRSSTRSVYTFDQDGGGTGAYRRQDVAAASPGGFCGVRGTAVMRPDFRAAHARDERYFEQHDAP